MPSTTKKTGAKAPANKKTIGAKAPTKQVTKTVKAKTTTKPKITTTPTETITTKRTRRVVNKDTILTDFDNLLTDFDTQIGFIRESDTKSVIGLKYFKTLTRQVKQLRMDVSKNVKVRKPANRDNNKTSGFMKPVSVSREISSFAGWKEDELHSRVDVTKFICAYIKDNDLQNPSDRRQIKPDKKLKSLLKLTDKEKEPLTYYSLQRHIQPHFTK
jgi:chromatin remodeling complex protein RSC6